MELFSIIAGFASILSLAISIFAVKKVYQIENRITDNSKKVKQSFKARDITNSEVKQNGSSEREIE